MDSPTRFWALCLADESASWIGGRAFSERLEAVVDTLSGRPDEDCLGGVGGGPPEGGSCLIPFMIIPAVSLQHSVVGREGDELVLGKLVRWRQEGWLKALPAFQYQEEATACQKSDL